MRHFIFIVTFVICAGFWQVANAADLAKLRKGGRVAGLEVRNLYTNTEGKPIGAGFVYTATGTPVFLLEIETIPQVLTWVDTPPDSNKGLAHALEHLLIGKGTKGRYFQLLEEMRLGQLSAVTAQDYVAYGLSSGAGVDGFFESFHALLDALYRPDFTDLEAEREFYHFAVTNNGTSKKSLTEQGTVYDEQRAVEDRYTYYFELSKRVLGSQNPFAFNNTGSAEEMRSVTPEDIRRFHREHYRLGPAIGFIFVFPPAADATPILTRISDELHEFMEGPPPAPLATGNGPKYPVHPSSNLDPAVYPFPGPNAATPGFIHFAWQPSHADSLQLKLLELFAGALAGREDSLLQRAIVDSKTRLIDSGATGVDSSLFLDNATSSPVLIVEVAGVPGNRMSTESISKIRNVLVTKIGEVSEYPDGSPALLELNQSISAYEQALHRSERVWTRNAPGFTGGRMPNTSWKTQLERLALDGSFTESVSEERVWQEIDQALKSGKNIWRDLIHKCNLLETPFATANAPSPQLLESIEKARQARLKTKTDELMAKYGTGDEQQALSRFEEEESFKTQEIDKIAASIRHPRFTENPPLTPDPNLAYRQFQIAGVPVIATFFDAPPTIDIGLTFDLHAVPGEYYKYLPLFVKCLDSLGLKTAQGVTTYSGLRREIQSKLYAFSTAYETDALSKRADFSIRASVATPQEFQSALDLIRQMMQSNYLDLANLSRLRDLVESSISADDWYMRADVSTLNAGGSFRYQSDPLYFALHSRFTTAHWNARLKWLLHDPVNADSLRRLETFADDFLRSGGISNSDLSDRLDAIKATGLEAELVAYWKKNLSNFSEAELTAGLSQLATEVHTDLQIGPQQVIEKLKELQQIILNRRFSRLDLNLSRSDLRQIEPEITAFLNTLAANGDSSRKTVPEANNFPITAHLKKRYPGYEEQAPVYFGFMNPNHLDGSIISYADFPGYSPVNHDAIVEVLASKIFSGRGPQGFFMKASESGLAYDSGIASDPRFRLVWYSANRVPNMDALLKLVNSIASTPQSQTQATVDYVLSQTFSFSRAGATFSERGKAMAQDLRDGDNPDMIRRFSETVLRLRKDPALAADIDKARLSSICGALVRDDCKQVQQSKRSQFFFAGSDKVLTEAEKAAHIPRLLRIWPADYWME